MLHILFVPGTFGTTIHYILRAFSTTYMTDRLLTTAYRDLVTIDGSMHSFDKTGHWLCKHELEDAVNGKIVLPNITTPIYPMPDYHADEIINLFRDNFPLDKYVFIYINSIEYAEINMLAQYHKVSTGVLNKTIDIFCSNNVDDIIKWNNEYTHWSELQLWELREWLSIFYPVWVQEWIDARQYADPTWLYISSEEILSNPFTTFRTILDYSGELDNTLMSKFNEFVGYWQTKQQYLLDEYELINRIVNTSISNESFNWSNLNIIAESIIQQKLRINGYEIKCYNLNEFPTSSIDLHNLLEPYESNITQ